MKSGAARGCPSGRCGQTEGFVWMKKRSRWFHNSAKKTVTRELFVSISAGSAGPRMPPSVTKHGVYTQSA